MNNNRLVLLEELNKEVQACRACVLCEQRGPLAVFGEGNPNASLMFLGEGPGYTEQQTGRPFTGPAGQLLDRILTRLNIVRSDTYILNIVKCRPPDNRTPTTNEMDACKPFLVRQIDIIQPKVIIGLGKVGFSALFPTYAKVPMKAIRGRTLLYGNIRVVPTWHPAYILRIIGTDKEKEVKQQTWDDFHTALGYL